MFLSLLLPFLAFLSPDRVIGQVEQHLLLHNPSKAVQIAKEAHAERPLHPGLHQVLLKSYASAGYEREMMQEWRHFSSLHPEKAYAKELLEPMLWGIVQAGVQSGSVRNRLYALIGAAITKDAYAVPLLLEGLEDPDSRLRAVSVELATAYRDSVLKKKIGERLLEEKVLEVRLFLTEAVGKLGCQELLPYLLSRLGGRHVPAAEKELLVGAVVALTDQLSSEELSLLAKHRRACMRGLVPEIIHATDAQAEIGLLIDLLEDSHPAVVSRSIATLGLMQCKGYRGRPIESFLQKVLDSQEPEVAITAGWLNLSVLGKGEILRDWVRFGSPRSASLAASAMRACGPRAVSYVRELLQEVHEPFVRMNLLFALLSTRSASQEEILEMVHFFETSGKQWMWHRCNGGLFEALLPSDLSHSSLIPNYPEAVNQAVHLEILGMLAVVEAPGAKKALRQFLRHHRWNLTGLAAELLLQEGDEAALDLLRELLKEDNERVRVEAALALATWGRDHSVLPILFEAYENADRQEGIRILESIGRVGSSRAVPFLVERLFDPSQSVRLVAAAVLLHTLHQ